MFQMRLAEVSATKSAQWVETAISPGRIEKVMVLLEEACRHLLDNMLLLR